MQATNVNLQEVTFEKGRILNIIVPLSISFWLIWLFPNQLCQILWSPSRKLEVVTFSQSIRLRDASLIFFFSSASGPVLHSVSPHVPVVLSSVVEEACRIKKGIFADYYRQLQLVYQTNSGVISDENVKQDSIPWKSICE